MYLATALGAIGFAGLAWCNVRLSWVGHNLFVFLFMASTITLHFGVCSCLGPHRRAPLFKAIGLSVIAFSLVGLAASAAALEANQVRAAVLGPVEYGCAGRWLLVMWSYHDDLRYASEGPTGPVRI